MNRTDFARNIIDTFERMEDVDMMAHSKYGESRRAHDYIRVDLPLMIDVAEGRDPNARQDLSPRQEALLRLSPEDMARKIEEDAGSARRVIGYMAPFTGETTRSFITGYEDHTRQLSKGLVSHKAERERPDHAAAIVNGVKIPLPADMFERVRADILKGGGLIPGDMVFLNDANRAPTENPYMGEKRAVAEIMVERATPDSATYFPTYRLEGERDYRKPSELLAAEGMTHGYGVVMEKAGKVYYVELESMVSGPIEEQHMRAREIVGINQRWLDKLDMDIKESNHHTTPSQPLSLDMGHMESNPTEIETQTPRNVREYLANEQGKIRTSGEFTMHPVDGPADIVGPVVLDASSWQSGVDPNEGAMAIRVIDAHLARYEYPRMTMREEAEARVQRDAGPRSEYERHPQRDPAMQQAMAAQAMAR